MTHVYGRGEHYLVVSIFAGIVALTLSPVLSTQCHALPKDVCSKSTLLLHYHVWTNVSQTLTIIISLAYNHAFYHRRAIGPTKVWNGRLHRSQGQSHQNFSCQNSWSLYSSRSVLIKVTSVFTLIRLDEACISSRLIWSEVSCWRRPPSTVVLCPQDVFCSPPLSSSRVKLRRSPSSPLFRLHM